MSIFVDTNVLVYAHDLDAPGKRAVALEITRKLWETREGILSTQVLQEFYVNITRKIAARVSKANARDLIKSYSAWRVAQIDPSDVQSASELEERLKISFWDALIVRAALKSNADVLLTEDLSSGLEIDGLNIQNPFSTDSTRP